MKVIKVQQQKQGYKVTTEDNKEYSISYIKGSFLYKETKAFIDEGGTIEPEFTLSDKKDTKKSKLNQLCEQEILNGFSSSALGEEHIYQSDRDDQLNLIGRASTKLDSIFKCGVEHEDGTIVWSWKMHTATQMQKVLEDGDIYKENLLKKCHELKHLADSAKTVEELEKANWH